MDLADCEKKGFVRKVSKDEGLVKSLIEKSKLKEKVVKESKVNEENISVYVSLAYDSLKEILDCVCLMNGYKVMSHICVGVVLKNLFEDFNFEDFDRMRWIRNSINYYGERVEFDQGMELIKNIFKMKKELSEKFLFKDK